MQSSWIILILSIGSICCKFTPIKMPGVIPNKTDSYLCTAIPSSDLNEINSSYITAYRPSASANRAHHMLMFSCNQPKATKKGGTWECLHHGVCKDQQNILFAWAKNADALTLPNKVSFKIDPAEAKYIVLQVHYAKPLLDEDHSGVVISHQDNPTEYLAAIYLLANNWLKIPAHTQVTHGDANCITGGNETIYPFAYRTHTHKLGIVVSGYKYDPDKEEFTEIAKGNPQWPQAFYSAEKVVAVSPNDYIHARCTYNSSYMETNTYIGSTGNDEMCNLYLMYYVKQGNAKSKYCGSISNPKIVKSLPDDSDKPLPYNGSLEEIAINGHHTISSTQSSESTKQEVLEESIEGDKDLLMPGATPDEADDYRCVAFRAKNIAKGQNFFITSFTGLASSTKLHHLTISMCNRPVNSPGRIYKCIRHSLCEDAEEILYAWATDGEPVILPEDVGFEVKSSAHLILQLHYKEPSTSPDYSGVRLSIQTKPPMYKAGTILLQRNQLEIPGKTLKVSGEMSCKFHTKEPLYIIAFRVHQHALGSVITAYRFKKGSNPSDSSKAIEIARGDPKMPQSFYPTNHTWTIEDGDVLAAKCTFNSLKRNRTTNIGPTNDDEMCNFYALYYTKNDVASSEESYFRKCVNEEGPHYTLPADSDIPLSEMGYPTNIGNSLSNQGYQPWPQQYPGSFYPQPQVYVPQVYPPPQQVYAQPGDIPISMDYSKLIYTTSTVSSTMITQISTTPDKVKIKTSNHREGKSDDSLYHHVPNWPPKGTSEIFGQISGVSMDVYGNPVVFHRGNNRWGYNTFDWNNHYKGDKSKPIPQATIVTLNETGHVINSWGENLFYMPHMITVDKKNNVWITDVALHQVMKFDPYGGKDSKPLITLGKRFEPGSDKKHFCKPTAVAVSEDGKTFFVADGYCNSRIIKYRVSIDSDGYHSVNVDVMMHWGSANGAGITNTLNPFAFNVPHGLALAEDKGLICVADRENGRVQCFKSLDGSFVRSFKHPEFGKTIYSIDYTPTRGGQLLALGGAEKSSLFSGKKAQVYVFDIGDETLVKTKFGGSLLSEPHDLAITSDGATVYVVEINPYRILKFTTGEIVAKPATPVSPEIPPVANTNKPSMTEQAKDILNQNIHKIKRFIPTSVVAVIISIISITLSVLICIVMYYRRRKRRGKGTMKLNSRSKQEKKLDLGDFLGRSKNGFKRVNTDDIGELSTDDSDLEDFSVPSLSA